MPFQEPLASRVRGGPGETLPWGTQNNTTLHDCCWPSAKNERAGRSKHLLVQMSGLKFSRRVDKWGPSPTTCWCLGKLSPHCYGPADVMLRACTMTGPFKSVMASYLSLSLIPIFWEGETNPHCNSQRCPTCSTLCCLLCTKRQPRCGSCRDRKGDQKAPPTKSTATTSPGTRSSGFCTVNVLLVTGFGGLNLGPSGLGQHSAVRLRHKNAVLKGGFP